mmetsp:Transcript_26382/g.36785  ORF Transcript_26382/g.36785 Transcript_26382/m.36785 type:complete len:417 (+) Transcript_26382:31-1281(+)
MAERTTGYGSFTDNAASFASEKAKAGNNMPPVEGKSRFLPASEGKQNEGKELRNLKSILGRISLEQYARAFEDKGFTNIEQLRNIEEWNVVRFVGESVGMRPGEILHFYNKISQDNPEDVDRELPSSFRERGGIWHPYRCCRMLRFYCGKMCSPLDFIVPLFLRDSFRQVVLRAHSGNSIKEIFTQIWARRKLIFSLILGGILGCWGLFPYEQDLSKYAIVLWECIMVTASTAALSVVMLSGTFETQIALVDGVNAKAYIISISEAFAFSQGMMIVSCLTFFFGLGYVGFIRVYQFAQGCELIGYAICAYVGILALFCLVCFNYTYSVVLRGGLMEGKRVGKVLRTVSATFEDRAKEEQSLEEAVIKFATDIDQANHPHEIISQGNSPRSGPSTYTGRRVRRRRGMRQVQSMTSMY